MAIVFLLKTEAIMSNGSKHSISLTMLKSRTRYMFLIEDFLPEEINI